MKALLVKLKKLNAVITQNEDGIFVDPIDEIPGEVYDEIIANADEIFDMVKEIEEIIISIEKWAGDNPDFWVTAHKRFNKDYKANPFEMTGYDYLMFWLNAMEHLLRAKQQIKKLNNRPGKEIEIASRQTDIRVYTQLAKMNRELLRSSLLHYDNLLESIKKYANLKVKVQVVSYGKKT